MDSTKSSSKISTLKKEPVGGLEAINEGPKKLAGLVSNTKAPPPSYKDRRNVKKATEITEKKTTNEIMDMEIKKLEEEKQQARKAHIANLLSNSDEEDEEL
jgi:hypothetical protein